MTIHYKVQIMANCYVMMTASEVIEFSRMSNPLMTPTLNKKDILVLFSKWVGVLAINWTAFFSRDAMGKQIQIKQFLILKHK